MTIWPSLEDDMGPEEIKSRLNAASERVEQLRGHL